ncbi:MAG: S-layer homology domain-containing protein [Candidatus Cloacimonetes bacterium]|nr:hypothetical protein [Deltaproteobacteria bacterium]MBM4399825.1 S-layer homology domain-containing protein [Candidatus Cloacimonadota bacterium]
MRFASLLDNSRKWIEIACLTLLLTCISSGVWGEPVTTIRNNGDPSNRLDLVILGDGYTASELGKYATDVETFVQGLFTQEPFREYQRFFNVHRVDVTSNESGADHPERNPPVYRDTALDATYYCYSIQRLICVNTSKVNTVVSNSVPADSRDVILVIVNDTEYGGSGGAVAVTSIHQDAVEIILHELGHSLGLLGDEYDYSPPPCNNAFEPSGPNVTRETNRNLIKWNVGGGPPTGWIELTTPIPTTSTTAGVPGLYEGARYCPSGLYRPTYNSKMRSLNFPFEQINSEQLVKRFYNWVAPIDTIEPIASNVTLPKGQNQTFRVNVPQPNTHNQNISWKVDGQTVGSGNNFTLNSSNLTIGIHTVEVLVTDPTSMVRNDPMEVLKESWKWDVTITISDIFSDVPTGHWAYDYIIAIYNAEITTGCAQDDPNTPENERKYCPEDNVDREQMAAFIIRAVEGEPPLNYCDTGDPFPDVTPDMWSCRYIKRLKELEITTGYRDGTYGPNDPVPREQMAAFIVRAVEGEPPLNYCDSGSLFTDVTSDMWSCRYIKRLYELAITTGYGDGRYGPYDLVTRAQMAAFLSRAFLGME